MIIEKPICCEPKECERKLVISTVETADYDVRIEVSIGHKKSAEDAAKKHAGRLLDELVAQLQNN